MNARAIAFLAAALALIGSLATCTPAKAQTNEALRAYIATLPPEIQREPQAIRAALKRPVVTEATNTVPRVRSANQKALVRAVVPALATREEFRGAPDKDKFLDDLIAAKLAASATIGEVRRIVGIQTLRMALLRHHHPQRKRSGRYHKHRNRPIRLLVHHHFSGRALGS